MRRNLRRSAAALLAALFLFLAAACSSGPAGLEKAGNRAAGEYAGKTVILHTNDVHGALEGYSYLPPLKAEIEAAGGTVILVDDGDFMNGNCYVSASKGESAVTLMEQAGYDIVGLGNHDLDFGYPHLKETLAKGSFRVLCANVFTDGQPLFDGHVIAKVGRLRIGFFSLLTPETQTKVSPAYTEGLVFTENEDLYRAAQAQIDELRKKCDLVICLSHLGVDGESLGNSSLDLYRNVTGLDFIIDGHSHTVMTGGADGEPIQSTGTGFETIGMVVIDNKAKTITDHRLIETEGLPQDPDVLATARNVIATVDDEYGTEFAVSSVELDGVKENVRTGETNLGDLITDAMLWSVTNETELDVAPDHVVVVTNGGGIRASVASGSVTKADIKTVLPFGNTLAVGYVTGAELLEALEASTFSAPEAAGGFPHIAGMKIRIDTAVPYDAGEEYPDSTYARPASIGRVTILEINGRAFDESDTYAVVTNDFCAKGGDTYYAFRRAYDAGRGFDTAIPLDEAVVHYIQYELGGSIGDAYAAPQGRVETVG